MNYIIKKTSAPIFRQHSKLALMFYNVNVGGNQMTARKQQMSRMERGFAAMWGSILVPIGLFAAHLYLIALFLRNPFQKIDL